MAATSYRYLVNLPGVCQGKTIVEGTRIGVHDVVGLILNGASVDDVCRSFPDLSRAQVYECLCAVSSMTTLRMGAAAGPLAWQELFEGDLLNLGHRQPVPVICRRS